MAEQSNENIQQEISESAANNELSNEIDELIEDIDEIVFVSDVLPYSSVPTMRAEDEDTVQAESSLESKIAPPLQEQDLSNDAVTEHTAALWKYVPVPDSEPEPAPEYKSDSTELTKSRIIAARVRGKKHKHDGTNCDDWYEFANFEDITFVAVSDGAGSKKFSRIGARVSCKAAIGYLLKTIGQLLTENPNFRQELSIPITEPQCMEACGILAEKLQQAVLRAYSAVESAFYTRFADSAYYQELKRSLQPGDFSATMLIAIIIPVGGETKENLIVTCQIGDGIIAVLNTEGDFETSVKLMCRPDSGEFSGETEFLTSPQINTIEALQSRTKIFRGIADTVFIMTDGVADDYFPHETEMHRLYFDLLANGILKSKSQSLSKDDFTQQQIQLLEQLPIPLSYPWVNDRNVKIALHNTKRICEATKLSMSDIWQDDTVLALACAESDIPNQTENPGERLKIWLDNYVERGSFDDRTLVIVQMQGNDKCE